MHNRDIASWFDEVAVGTMVVISRRAAVDG